MKVLISLLLSCTILCLVSCADEPDGKATDTIKLSKSKIDFGAVASEQIITTASHWWWVSEVKVNGENIYIGEEIDYGSTDFNYIGEWYTFKRENDKLIISVLENTTGKTRNLYIGLQAGNWFGSRIDVNQKYKE